MTEPDFRLTQTGSIDLLEPLTDEAREWADEFLPEDAQMLGRAYAIEPRYMIDILGGIDDAGLTVDDE